MYRLVQAGLFGAGLVSIKTFDLVHRYNRCLEEIGIAPTALTSFSVDGMGWSPEIAEEKKDPNYLSHGDASDLAIIISLNQWKKPIHFPRNSYDRNLMTQYFAENHERIADITLSGCLWLDMEQDILRYEKPQDLLEVHKVTVVSSAGEISSVAAQQKEMAREYLETEHGWSDRSLRQRIEESAKKYGNLLKRDVIVPPMVYDDMRCFYTRAFGGTFVYRNKSYQKSVLIVEDENHASLAKEDVAPVYQIHDEAVVRLLFQLRLLDVNFDLHKAHPEIIERVCEGIVADAVCQSDPKVNYIALSAPAKKRKIADIGSAMPEVYYELETVERYLQAGETPDPDSLSPEARLLLLHPSSLVTDTQKELVWQLIMKLQKNPVDVLRLYTVDKMDFFNHYKTWPDSKKEWAVKVIKENYIPKMSQ